MQPSSTPKPSDKPSSGPPLTNSSQIPNPTIISTINAILSEEREKEKCQLNLIVHQLAESTKEDPKSRKTDDIDASSKLIQKYIGTPATITSAIRLGSKGAKPRLLKIYVSSNHEKGLILKKTVQSFVTKTIPKTSKEFISHQTLLQRNNRKIRL